MPSPSPDRSRPTATAIFLARVARPLLSCAAAWLVAPAWAAAPPDDGFPPPGLYRIDIDSTVSPAGTSPKVRIEENGTTGHAVGTWSDAQGNRTTRSFEGKGPNTWCMPPRGNDPAALAAVPGAQACRNQGIRRTEDGLEFSSVCPVGTFATTIRKIDATTWEYLTRTTSSPSAGGSNASLDGVRAILTYQASHAPTAAERDKATKDLANLSALQPKMDAARAKAQSEMEAALKNAPPEKAAAIRQQMAAMQSGQPATEAVSKQRWTRIADSCAAGGK